MSPAHRTLFLSHEDCLDHKLRSNDEWESPARIDAIFEALKDPEYATWLDADKVRVIILLSLCYRYVIIVKAPLPVYIDTPFVIPI